MPESTHPTTRSRRLLVFGTGDVATKALALLAHSPTQARIRVVGRNSDKTLRTANMARLSANQLGHLPAIDWAVTDIEDESRTADVIASFRPDVIFNAMSLQAWHVITQLPREGTARLIKAGYGPWLSMHLAPARALMLAVRASGVRPTVVNAAFPDAVHPALAPAGLSPDAGIGNVANYVPGLRSLVAGELGVEAEKVEIRFIAHHYVSFSVSRQGQTNGAPYHLGIRCDGEDLTKQLDPAELFRQLSVREPRTGGRDGQLMTAASAVSVLRPLLSGESALVHVPGFGGRVGGWTAQADGGELRLDLPENLSEAAALEINNSGQRFDGIDRFDADGTAHFTDAAREVMRAELGFDAGPLRPEDSFAYSAELGSIFTAALRRQWLSAQLPDDLLVRL